MHLTGLAQQRRTWHASARREWRRRLCWLTRHGRVQQLCALGFAHSHSRLHTGSSPLQAYSALREHQALVLSEQGELQATVSQMRDEIKAKDAELAKLKPDHRPSFWSEPKQVRLGRRPRWRAPLTRVPPQMGDSGRPTYEGLKQKVQEKDKQLEEALAIIKELTEALQGVRTRGALPPFCVLLRPATCGHRKLPRQPQPAPRWCARRAVTVLRRRLSPQKQAATATTRNLKRCVHGCLCACLRGSCKSC